MKVVTAAIIFHQQRILIAQRKHGKDQEYLWEFPGGKQEVGESLETCLKRELLEELGLNIEVGFFFMESQYDYASGSILLKAFFATCLDDNIRFLDAHEQVKWISPNEFSDYTFSPADIPIVNALQQELSSK